MMLLMESYELSLQGKSSKVSSDRAEPPKDENKIYTGDVRLEIFDFFENHQKENPSWNPKFYESVRGFYKETGFITLNQFNALLKFYERIKSKK